MVARRALVLDDSGYARELPATDTLVGAGGGLLVGTTMPAATAGAEWFNPDTGRTYAAVQNAGSIYVWVEESVASTAASWKQVTQAEYDALTPDPQVLYVIVG